MPANSAQSVLLSRERRHSSFLRLVRVARADGQVDRVGDVEDVVREQRPVVAGLLVGIVERGTVEREPMTPGPPSAIARLVEAAIAERRSALTGELRGRPASTGCSGSWRIGCRTAPATAGLKQRRSGRIEQQRRLAESTAAKLIATRQLA